MKGPQGAAHLLVCLAWEMLALAKSLSFPDIPRLSWPQERGWWSQAPAQMAAGGGWQEKSDNEVSEPPWPLGSFLPITQGSVAWRSGALSDHQHRPGSLGSCEVSARTSLKPDSPFSTWA